MKILPNDWKQLIDNYIARKRKMIFVYRKKGLDTTYNEMLILKAIEVRDEIQQDVKFGLKGVKKCQK